jgi:hypothetical protein
LTVGIQLRGQEDEAFSIASIRDDDIDVGESFGATLRVQLSVHNGQIQLSKFSGFKAGVQKWKFFWKCGKPERSIIDGHLHRR